MENSNKIYVDVILPVSVPNLYTYSIPTASENTLLVPGIRVCVQFGKRKLYTAIIAKVHHTAPEYETKEILTVLDNYPVVSENQIKFWKWIAQYYMCNTGDVYNAALPGGLRPEGQTCLFVNHIPEEGIALSGSENTIVNIIEKNPGITIDKISNLSERKSIMPVLRNLLNLGAISLEESLKESYKPKVSVQFVLHPNLQNEQVLQELLNTLERRAPKQLEALLTYLDFSGYLSHQTFKAIDKSLITSKPNISNAAIKALIDKEIFIVKEVEISRLEKKTDRLNAKVNLNEKQQLALSKIRKSFNNNDITLLHGVTSSGKTELYIHLIEEQLEQNKQVLYLLPEIALTTQIIRRLRNVFGNRVGVYHSKFNDSERVEVWNNLLKQDPKGTIVYDIILGVRSSVFLPFNNLGLIIVDEEHENTYKQYDPAPRYHARDAAIVLAGMHKAKVLLGTATPSLESYFNAKTGKYGYVELLQRHLDIQLPEIVVSNIREARRKKINSGNFTPALVNEIQAALNSNEQIILFQNRRGFSPYLECNDCAWIPGCVNCDVNLTYHKAINKLICHYCGYSLNAVTTCKACGSHDIQTRGFGTEKVEDEIKLIFPNAKVQRMDLDSTRRKKAYEEIIDSFSCGQVDILIGTQMVSKGLDFDNVSVVGILNADNMLNFPDFRAYERSFQLMSQVSGRAGRKKKQGKVIIQTSDSQNIIIKQVVNSDFKNFFNIQLVERKNFFYPPFFRLIKISLRHRDKVTLNKASLLIVKKLKGQFGSRVLGPEAPIIGRIHNWHIRQIIIKLEKNKEIPQRKLLIYSICNAVRSQQGFSALQIIYDVDPM
jgi:primosomal protein N' (replication factor Y)